MKSLRQMTHRGFTLFISPLERWFGRRTILGVLALVLVLTMIGVWQRLSTTSIPVAATEAPETPITVTTTSLSLLSATDSEFTLVGTVNARSEAGLVAERGGRVTSVPVRLGQPVVAGTVIATFENASERAGVAQAEAALAAARASARQTTSSITDAETGLQQAQNGAVVVYNNAFTTLSQILTTSIDPYFSDPQATIPGLRISGFGNTNLLNNERVALTSIFNDWQTRTSQLRGEDINLVTTLTSSLAIHERFIAFLDIFLTILPQQPTQTTSQTEWQRQTSLLSTERARVLASRNTIEQAIASLSTATEAVARARIAGSSTTLPSLAEAQIRQAEAGVMQANAQLARTIVRAPITGTISSLTIKLGDTVSPQSPIGRIVNEQGREITILVNEAQRQSLRIGQEVVVHNSSMPGIITQIAPSISPQTGRIEVRIATNDTTITIGDTVRVTASNTSTSDSGRMVSSIPLNAVRFIGDEAFVFTIEDSRLRLSPIEVGSLQGSTITVVAGLSPDTQFVSDARGLQTGRLVTVTQ